MITLKQHLDRVYRKYNRKQYVSPDPLQFLYDYPEISDREIVALIASSLAYGRVAQILKSVRTVLAAIPDSPCAFLTTAQPATIKRSVRGFKHRFTTDTDLASLLLGIRTVIKDYGSLNECFVHGMERTDSTVIPALQHFTDSLACEGNYLIPSPARGSACKRLNLFLRWMVRKDAVDPGGWTGVPTNKLLVPLDAHMQTVGQMLKLTTRRSANINMALDITSSFTEFAPSDPVKYDFALTRFGIRDDLTFTDLADSLSRN